MPFKVIEGVFMDNLGRSLPKIFSRLEKDLNDAELSIFSKGGHIVSVTPAQRSYVEPHGSSPCSFIVRPYTDFVIYYVEGSEESDKDIENK